MFKYYFFDEEMSYGIYPLIKLKACKFWNQSCELIQITCEILISEKDKKLTYKNCVSTRIKETFFQFSP